VKELKVFPGAVAAPRAQQGWNPVKELKGIDIDNMPNLARRHRGIR